jgi:hypothetical protein
MRRRNRFQEQNEHQFIQRQTQSLYQLKQQSIQQPIRQSLGKRNHFDLALNELNQQNSYNSYKIYSPNIHQNSNSFIH